MMEVLDIIEINYEHINFVVDSGIEFKECRIDVSDFEEWAKANDYHIDIIDGYRPVDGHTQTEQEMEVEEYCTRETLQEYFNDKKD